MHSNASKKEKETAQSTGHENISSIKIQHRGLMTILSDMGFRGSASEKTFHDYIKSLRKLGMPVSSAEAPRNGHMIVYSYENVVDLALALSLRVYHVIPDSVLRELVRARPVLHRLYRQAYHERSTGLGSPVRVGSGSASLMVQGIYLDLKLNHVAGRLVSFGPPTALSPFEAVRTLTDTNIASRAFRPFPLSVLCEQIVSRSKEAMVADEEQDQVAAGSVFIS
jgi:hypothetical protein